MDRSFVERRVQEVTALPGFLAPHLVDSHGIGCSRITTPAYGCLRLAVTQEELVYGGTALIHQSPPLLDFRGLLPGADSAAWGGGGAGCGPPSFSSMRIRGGFARGSSRGVVALTESLREGFAILSRSGPCFPQEGRSVGYAAPVAVQSPLNLGSAELV